MIVFILKSDENVAKLCSLSRLVQKHEKTWTNLYLIKETLLIVSCFVFLHLGFLFFFFFCYHSSDKDGCPLRNDISIGIPLKILEFSRLAIKIVGLISLKTYLNYMEILF